MKYSLLPLSLLFLSILGASCKEEVRYNKEQMLKIALAADPSVKLLLPDKITGSVFCSDYSKGCLSAHMVRAKGLVLIAVEFDTEKNALYAAKKFRGYYLKNWLFDDVSGEPILERFVTDKLKAQRP